MTNGYSVFTPESILYGEGGVCQAYTLLTQLMLEALNIESRFVSGIATAKEMTDGHAWNLVKVDGEWYHLDVTWNDPLPDRGPNSQEETYLLKSDEFMAQSRTWDRNNYPQALRNYKGK